MLLFFFFKQKTAYEMRISDWSSGVCSSDLLAKATDGVGGIVLPNEPTTRTDPLVVFFTSGTVSFPKMVLHDQSYALGHVATARFWHDLRPGDRHWTVSDTGWAKAAWGGLFGQWHEGAPVVQVAVERADPDIILDRIARRQITGSEEHT